MPNYKVTVRIEIEWEEEIEAPDEKVALEMAESAARRYGSVISTDSMFEEVQ